MRRRGLVRQIAAAALVAGAFAAAAAGCGREGDLIKTRATTPGTATTATTTTPVPVAPSSDARLRAIAASYARRRFGVRAPINDVTLRRSRRAPRWLIASGADGRTLWVVWLRDGTVALATTDVRRFNPKDVPCDIRPAFSESSC